MAKYYVESGPNLQVILQAKDFVEAILKTLELVATDQPLFLADVIIVNQRGFVWQREEHELYGDEMVLPTSLVLGAPENEHPSSH